MFIDFRRFLRLYVFAIVLALLLTLTIYGGLAYVIIHFVRKFW